MHGYLSCGKSFFNQIKFFERDYNVFAPDLKGFGDNSLMDYPYSLTDYVNDVKEYMYKNSIICPNVVAHSFGARIALKAVSSSNEVFNKMVLTGAAGLKPRFSLKKCAKRTLFKLLKPIFGKQKLKRFYSEDYNKLSCVMQKSFIKITNEHLDDCLNKISNPVLLIFGSKDKQTPLYMAKRLNKGLVNGTLKIFNGAGHFAFIDCPYKFNLEVKEFLLSI